MRKQLPPTNSNTMMTWNW